MNFQSADGPNELTQSVNPQVDYTALTVSAKHLAQRNTLSAKFFRAKLFRPKVQLAQNSSRKFRKIYFLFQNFKIFWGKMDFFGAKELLFLSKMHFI